VQALVLHGLRCLGGVRQPCDTTFCAQEPTARRILLAEYLGRPARRKSGHLWTEGGRAA
jgi:hypothetical protein